MCKKPYVETPVGEVTIGDIVCYYKASKVVKFGVVYNAPSSYELNLHKCFSVHNKYDGKQGIYQLMNTIIHTSEVKDIL